LEMQRDGVRVGVFCGMGVLVYLLGPVGLIRLASMVTHGRKRDLGWHGGTTGCSDDGAVCSCLYGIATSMEKADAHHALFRCFQGHCSSFTQCEIRSTTALDDGAG